MSSAAQVPGIAQTAFQHLPPMASQPQSMPIKLPAGPKRLVAHAQTLPSQQCVIPLLNVTPDSKTNFAIRTVTPPQDPTESKSYVKTPPVCDTAGQSAK